MSDNVSRRRFLEVAAAGTVAASAVARTAGAAAATGANDKIVVAMMGVNSRGSALTQLFAAQPNCEVAYICDVDERALGKGIAAATSKQDRTPKGIADFREALDDKSVDALIIAAPDHWHAPATILGCSAGKHVYVEKPASHNPHEGELMVQAARKNKRVVQLGIQRRSWTGYQEAIQRIHDGELGNVHFARSIYNNRRGPTGVGKKVAAPDWLNYKLWQGPAPERPYQDNVVHYKWHWFWDWGTGEAGNNGTHTIDLCRWALGVDFPTRVVSAGGRYRYDDDQETPDTQVASFEFSDSKSKKMIVWESLSWSPTADGTFVSIHGDKGSMKITDSEYAIYDMKRALVSKHPNGETSSHQQDFLDAIRSDRKPNADIGEGHKSTLLCHLANIAQRTGHAINTDPTNGHIKDDAEAQALWSREYRPGWEPKV